MVYSSPPDYSSVPPFRPPHRRARSSAATFSNEKGEGAFAPLGSLPRRKSSPKKFHFRADEDEDDEEPPSLDSVRKVNALGLSVDTENLTAPRPSTAWANGSIPFPRTSTSSPRPSSDPPSRTSSPRPPSIQRTPSSPVILLANGKPLKSSLKSSASSPNIPSAHIRAQSAPSTPSLNKSVHFAGDDEDCSQLETVRLFRSTGKPASLSKPGEETETETEADPSSSYPFPMMGSSSSPFPAAPHSVWEIDPESSSAVPQVSPPPAANIYLESLTLLKTRPLTLRGSVLVKNISFEKNVAVRFTLDDWQTTSEVICKHVVSLPGLPPPFPRVRTVGDAVGLLAHAAGQLAPTQEATNEEERIMNQLLWDRFSFSIRLEDYEQRLSDRTMFLVARYTAPGQGEWWDNNSFNNFKLGFRRVSGAAAKPVEKEPSSPVMNSSQQRSFSAPSTLRGTPVTFGGKSAPPSSIALPPSPYTQPNPPSESSSVPFPTITSPTNILPSSLTRTVSSPPLSNLLPYVAPAVYQQRRPSLPTGSRLKLANYAAPTSVVSPLMSPVMGVGSSLFHFGGSPTASPNQPPSPDESAIVEEDEAPGDSAKDVARPQSEESSPVLPRAKFELIGGHPATISVSSVSPMEGERKPEPNKVATFDVSSPSSAGTQSSNGSSNPNSPDPSTESSSSSTSPSSSGTSTPTTPSPNTVLPPNNIKSTTDSTYAAFVRHWCFAQSPTTTPQSTPPQSFATPGSAPNNGWLGLEGYGFGYADLRGVGRRSEAGTA